MVARIGPAHRYTEMVLIASLPGRVDYFDDIELARFIAGFNDLYSIPWLQRIWVQQEVFVAKDLVLQWDDYRFCWTATVSDPEQLTRRFYRLQTSKQERNNLEVFLETLRQKNKLPLQTVDQLPDFKKAHAKIKYFELVLKFSFLKKFEVNSLQFFEQTIKPKPRKMSLMDALMKTDTCSAGRQRDKIYGILGMTTMYARACSISEWMSLRCSTNFIPIYYTSEFKPKLQLQSKEVDANKSIQVLCTVMWTSVASEGLGSLS